MHVPVPNTNMPSKNKNKKKGGKSSALLTTKITVAPTPTSDPVNRPKGSKPRNRRRNQNASHIHSIPNYVYALLDPFNSTAYGAKVPDSEMALSTTCYSRTADPLITDGTYGTAVRMYFPDPANRYYAAATFTSATAWTFAANWTSQGSVPNLSAMSGAFTAVRAVGYGLRISCPQAYLNASGRLHVCLCPVDYSRSSLNTALPLNTNSMMQLPGYMTVPIADLIADSVLVVGKPSDSGSLRYRTLNYPWNVGSAAITAGLETSTGWLGIMVAVESCAVGVIPINVESIIHYEAQVLAQTGAGIVEPSPAAPHQPVIMATSQNLIASIPAARVIDEEQLVERDLWEDISDIWDTGVKVANGIADAAVWINAMHTRFRR